MRRFLPLLVLFAGCGGDVGDEATDPGSDLHDPADGYEGLAAVGTAAARTILLLSLDTLRADHLSLHGYERPTSPELEDLAREAVVYTRARSTSPWTLPSHASLFTGQYSHEHGAHNAISQEGDFAAALPAQARTLAEVLRDRGYRTGAVVANIGFLGEPFRLNQGFETYDAERGAVRDVNARALAWLDAQGEAPVFLFVNYMDTHRPYNCVPRPGFPDRGTPDDAGANVKKLRRLLIQGSTEIPPELLGEIVDQYDTSIANLDEGLGELFDALRERGRFEDALLVVTSDHGEFLGEKLLVEHSKDVYEPVLHVPLIVRPPGGVTGIRDERPVSGVHVAGLVLSHAGLDPGDAELGRFFAHWPRGDVLAEQFYSRPHDMKGAWETRLRRVRRALIRGDWKYIQSSDGANELYDLAADPEELVNLFERDPERAGELALALTSGYAKPDLLRGGASESDLVRVGAGDDGTMAELGYAGEDDEED